MNLNEMKALDSQYFLGVFGDRTPVCFVRGEGSTLYDQDGKAYTTCLPASLSTPSAITTPLSPAR